jgi:hypothetical protein
MLPILPSLALQLERPPLIIPGRKVVDVPSLILPDRRVEPVKAISPGIIAGARRRGVVTDPNFPSVSLLLGFDADPIADESSNHFATSGSGSGQTRDTSIFKYGVSSVALNGTSGWVQFADNAAFELGSGDFTLEGWYRFSTVGAGFQCFASKYNASGSQRSWLWYYNGSGNMVFGVSTNGSAVTNIVSTAWTPTASTWYFLAASRASGTLKIFVDGSQIASVASTHNLFSGTAPLRLGGLESSGTVSSLFAGNVDDFRMTKGVGRYTANFTPPTAAFPRS